MSTYSVGDTVVLDGVVSLIIYDAGSEQDWGRYILADKNHDLCYYITGNDYVNSTKYNISPGTFGYEWGGYGTDTGITSLGIGDGLSNTNSLISMNLQPDTSGWRVVWDMIEQFRSVYSDKWFVPTVNELKEVYNQRSYLENLSTSINTSYWCSSGYDNTLAYVVLFDNGSSATTTKRYHSERARLCRYTTDTELDELYASKTWLNDEIITANDLNRIERKVNKKYSNYLPTSWSPEDVLSKDRLNKIETQIGSKKVWEDGNVVTVDDLNNIENLLEP